MSFWKKLLIELDDQVVILQKAENLGLNPAWEVMHFGEILLPAAKVERFPCLRALLECMHFPRNHAEDIAEFTLELLLAGKSELVDEVYLSDFHLYVREHVLDLCLSDPLMLV